MDQSLGIPDEADSESRATECVPAHSRIGDTGLVRLTAPRAGFEDDPQLCKRRECFPRQMRDLVVDERFRLDAVHVSSNYKRISVTATGSSSGGALP